MREKRVKNGIEKKEQLLLNLEKRKEKELVDFREKMKDRYKVVSPAQPEITQVKFFKVNDDKVKKLVESAKKVLMKRIPYVD